MKNALNISLFGEEGIGKSTLIQDYINQNNNKYKKEKGGNYSFIKTFKEGVSMKLSLYEYNSIPDKKTKDIAGHHCIIIIFDMTSRNAFEDVLDKWIKFLRDIKYNNSIILFGTKNLKNEKALPMTDEAEIKDLIQVADIKGEFYDIGNKTKEQKNQLIDNLKKLMKMQKIMLIKIIVLFTKK